MHDGRTRRIETRDLARPEDWLAENRASLVVLNGPLAGSEFELLSARILVGRSPAADLRLDDHSVSTEHAAVELQSDGFGIRDLASTNGVKVNGAPSLLSELKHGDRIDIGEVVLHYLVAPREDAATP